MLLNSHKRWSACLPGQADERKCKTFRFWKARNQCGVRANGNPAVRSVDRKDQQFTDSAGIVLGRLLVLGLWLIILVRATGCLIIKHAFMAIEHDVQIRQEHHKQ